LIQLGNLYSSQSLYSKAEPELKRALLIARKTLGPNNADLNVYRQALEACYKKQGKNGKLL
ncbi:MAG: tetratricopeptide repeat protein, partial [Candidatus Obscuribacterales bacterium]|nr:tetratricopeptide repeat protein [Candidatus Obscuribacterales bacterium]